MDFEQAVYNGYVGSKVKEGFVRVWYDDGQGGGGWEDITIEEDRRREEAIEQESALNHEEEGGWFCSGFRL